MIIQGAVPYVNIILKIYILIRIRLIVILAKLNTYIIGTCMINIGKGHKGGVEIVEDSETIWIL